MATITLKGNPIRTNGELPHVGHACPPFTLTRMDLSELSSVDLEGQRVVLNIFPSIDTSTCAASVRAFNERAGEAPNTVVLCVSMDLPFATKRFCAAEGLVRVLPASAFRHPDFGKNFGLTMTDGPLRALLARAIVVLDEHGTIVHTELVKELAHEPDYDSALSILARHHQAIPEDALESAE